ncbi:hypothetical protein PIB30_056993 [Stylosanthes scabra]|uniref:Integrase zinc-binding domain-containing protein n=1 Tax=Stylosanthes scabra TaxID=79078 RepID=A0ABU6UL61_9FABA|nr:hypothetical protein [Stylosanthes scabra]
MPLLKCVEEKRVPTIIAEVHDGACGQHQGVKTIIRKILLARVYWPLMRRFIGVEKSMKKAKKNIGSKNGLEKACKSGDFTKKKGCEARKRSYIHQIGANLDSLER